MRFSVIIPSYNQFQFIESTLQNIVALKKLCLENNHEMEVILFDNNSNEQTQRIIQNYATHIDVLNIESDKGQYEAINKGLKHVTGDYWTWLNTDDLIDLHGFLAICNYLKNNQPDYIYGDIELIDASGKPLSSATSGAITLSKLTIQDASISQPGSFFKTSFTNKIGNLQPYRFAFDYEYILRILKNNGTVVHIKDIVSQFRYYEQSKSGSKDPRFLIEQWQIAKLYGSRFYNKLFIILILRIIKRKLF